LSGGRKLNEYAPEESVLSSFVNPLPVLVTEIFAGDMIAPLESVTLPLIEPVLAVCAKAGWRPKPARRIASKAKVPIRRLFISSSRFGKTRYRILLSKEVYAICDILYSSAVQLVKLFLGRALSLLLEQRPRCGIASSL
jgi:hypothetical protein